MGTLKGWFLMTESAREVRAGATSQTWGFCVLPAGSQEYFLQLPLSFLLLKHSAFKINNG